MFKRIPILSQIVNYWRVFRRFSGTQLFIYILISFVVTLTESIGITFFFPLLSQLSGSSSAPASTPSARYLHAVNSVFNSIGVPMTVTSLLMGILTVFFLKAILQAAAGAYQSSIISRFLVVISERLYRGYTEVNYSYFLKTNVGTLTNILLNETGRAMVAFVRYVSLLPPLITILIFMSISLTVDWRLTIFSVFFGLVLLIIFKFLSTLARKYSYQYTDGFNRLSSLTVQSLSGFKYLVSTSSFPPLRKQVFQAIRNVAKIQFKMSTVATASQTVNEPSIVLFMVGLIWYQTVFRGRAISEVFVLILFFYRLIKEVMAFQGNWNGFCSTMGSLDLVTRIIDETGAHRQTQGPKKLTSFSDRIQLDHLSFGYNAKAVLHGVTMDIPRNQTVALVGESGSGKSTMIDLVTGLLTPTSGMIRIDGVPYSEVDLHTFRTAIGYVTQEGALFDDTVANNISLWSCDPQDPANFEKIRKAAELANCDEFITKMPNGYHSIIGERGVVLSGGQKQRLAIAREIFKEPALLILDEATSALDTENEREIQKSIDRLKGRTTVIVIAHRLSTIRSADCIYVLSAGKIIEQGTFTELSQRNESHFKKICQMQGLV